MERDRRTSVRMRSTLSKELRELWIWLECESKTRKDGERLGSKHRNVEEDFFTYRHVSKRLSLMWACVI